MKKRFAFRMLALALCLLFTGASLCEENALGLFEEELPVCQKGGKAGSVKGTEPALMEKGIFHSRDEVEIDGEHYRITCPEGIVLDYTLPDASTFCLTPDYSQQWELYSQFYNDPAQAAQGFAAQNVKLNIYEIEQECDLYLYLNADSQLGGNFADSNLLTETEAEAVMNALFPGQTDCAYGSIGGNLWFVWSRPTQVCMVTFVNGVCVLGEFQADESEKVEKGLTLLQNLTITGV